MKFEDSFYEPETREDFYIEGMVKRYWACNLDIVERIDQICKKYGLTYYADWGTLLGTIRHGGYVPWDDDIDLALKRPDYQKLLSVLPKELPPEYLINTCFTMDEHKQYFTGISDGSVINVSKEFLAKHHGCPFVAVIDIFPLDYLPRDAEEATVLKELFYLTWLAIDRIQKEADDELIEEAVVDVETYLNVTIDRNRPLTGQLWRYANLLAMSYTEEDGDYLVPWTQYINSNESMKFQKEWYDEIEFMPFEGIQMPVPKHYDEILKTMYGDYHIRRKLTSLHDYPAFKSQLERMKKRVEKMKADAGKSEG